MNFFSWNCRDLDNSTVIFIIGDLVRIHRLDVIFFCETLVHSHQIEKIKSLIHFNGCFSVNLTGRSGDLAIL